MSEPWPGDLAGLLALSSSLLSLSCRGPTNPAPPPLCATDIEGPLLCTIIELPLPCTAMDCELQTAQAYRQHKAFQENHSSLQHCASLQCGSKQSTCRTASAKALHAASCINELQVVYRLQECSGICIMLLLWCCSINSNSPESLCCHQSVPNPTELDAVNNSCRNYGCLTHIPAVLNMEDNQ